MNLNKYPILHGNSHANGEQALHDAFAEGTIRLVRMAQNMPGAQQFLMTGWEVIITFPRQPNLIYSLGSYGDKKKAEGLRREALKVQEGIRAEHKAKLTAQRIRNREYRRKAEEETARLLSMTPEERQEYWIERRRKHEEEMAALQKELDALREGVGAPEVNSDARI